MYIYYIYTHTVYGRPWGAPNQTESQKSQKQMKSVQPSDEKIANINRNRVFAY